MSIQRQTLFAFPDDDQVELIEPPGPMPRLSEQLPGPKHPGACQACASNAGLTRWQEHDEQDRPERILVVLCGKCSKRLIDPHPRLYRELDRYEPWPGAMTLCYRCIHRSGVRCGHPDAKANGGTGVKLTIAPQTRVHIKSSRRSESGMFRYWPSPATDCDRLEVYRVVGGDHER